MLRLQFNTKKYPSLSLDLKDLEGEIWKDIPGFEDEYQLSNFGRVKSQKRWVNHGEYDYYLHERIRKLKPPSQKKNDINIQITLHKEGKRYAISIPRYTYFLFVAP